MHLIYNVSSFCINSGMVDAVYSVLMVSNIA